MSVFTNSNTGYTPHTPYSFVYKRLSYSSHVQAYVISPEEELRFWRVSQKLLRAIGGKWKKKKKKNEL